MHITKPTGIEVACVLSDGNTFAFRHPQHLHLKGNMRVSVSDRYMVGNNNLRAFSQSCLSIFCWCYDQQNRACAYRLHPNFRPFWENIITLIAISIKRARLQTSFPHDLRGNAASTYLSSKSPVNHRASLPSSTMKICNKSGWIQKSP